MAYMALVGIAFSVRKGYNSMALRYSDWIELSKSDHNMRFVPEYFWYYDNM